MESSKVNDMLQFKLEPKLEKELPTIGYKTPRTSFTHPINVSWVLTEVDQRRVQSAYKTTTRSVMTRGETKFLGNRVSLSTYDPIKRQDYELTEIEQTPVTLPGSTIKLTHGNFALSSCPGKKVRLDGPRHGKAMIARDLVQDLERISSLNIKTIICCLDNKELEFLGAPWKLYKHEAQKLGMNVIRLPIVEGKSPKSVEEVDALMEQLDDLSPPNHHILCHCRGGTDTYK